MARNTDDRVTRLEEKIAYQERTIGDLDEVVRDLNAKVTRMSKVLEELKIIARDVENLRNEVNKSEAPPHYGGFGSAAKQ